MVHIPIKVAHPWGVLSNTTCWEWIRLDAKIRAVLSESPLFGEQMSVRSSSSMKAANGVNSLEERNSSRDFVPGIRKLANNCHILTQRQIYGRKSPGSSF